MTSLCLVVSSPIGNYDWKNVNIVNIHIRKIQGNRLRVGSLQIYDKGSLSKQSAM